MEDKKDKKKKPKKWSLNIDLQVDNNEKKPTTNLSIVVLEDGKETFTSASKLSGDSEQPVQMLMDGVAYIGQMVMKGMRQNNPDEWRSVEPIETLKPGIYKGLASGYRITIESESLHFETTISIEGNNIPVEVDIDDKNHYAYIKTIADS